MNSKDFYSKYWLYLMYILGIITFILLCINWGNWTALQIGLALNAIVLPLHVIEEWKVPGGFHYAYNVMHGSNLTDRYPMSEQTDFITNFFAEIIFVIMFLYFPYAGFAIALMIFDLFEAIIHTHIGYQMYKRLKTQGKRTIYSPGSITAYLGHGLTAIFILISLFTVKLSLIDIVIAVVTLILSNLLLITWPEKYLKDENSPYAFSDKGYFEKYEDIKL